VKFDGGKNLKKLGKNGCVPFSLLGQWNWKTILFWNVMLLETSRTVMAFRGEQRFLLLN